MFVSDGSTVLGADAKASVAALLEMAHVLAGVAESTPRPPIALVLTWGEHAQHGLDLPRSAWPGRWRAGQQAPRWTDELGQAGSSAYRVRIHSAPRQTRGPD